MLYSKLTNSWYDAALHLAVPMPADVVEVPAEKYEAIKLACASGKVLAADKKDMPVAINPPAPSDEQAAEAARTARIPLLTEADVLVNIAEDNGQDSSAARAYRQALRDVTKQAKFPTVTWPAKP